MINNSVTIRRISNSWT